MKNYFIALNISFLLVSCSQSPEKATFQTEAPDEYRFTKKILTTNVIDPIDMCIDDEGNIYYTERKGYIKKYNPKTKKVNLMAHFTCDSGSWDGGMKGIVLDPNFNTNRELYIYYVPVPDKGIQRISKLRVSGDIIDKSSEKIIIEFFGERQRHMGGSMAFDSKGNLYFSSGDNTNPEENPYSPHDNRPGKIESDAMRSSGNTNDLRGKISRIKPLPYGGYAIPDGNLFEQNEPLTRPEIYVMGCRNAFKIHVDKQNDVLYWGDVGPDAGGDGEPGPKGYDEFNRTTKPGNFGWPYFVGNNKAYKKRDFATNTLGGLFDTLKPENISPNNTGKRILPPAQPAWVWYPYDESKEFPMLGSGGRTALSGPVYHYRYANKNPNALPKYFDKKLFVMEWMRNWIMSIDPKTNKIEPFMPTTFFNKPMDIEFGPDGCMYMLEYGSNWVDNSDARLVKVEYLSGNRAPIAEIAADKTTGAVPLTVKFSSKGSKDYDKNSTLGFEWNFTSKLTQSTDSMPTFTFTTPGVYSVRLNVYDEKGAHDFKDIVIKAGNTMPEISINGIENNQFYFKNQLSYQVQLSDKEDKIVNLDKVFIKLIKDPDGMKAADTNPYDTMAVGQKLISKSDCKGCHALNKASTGPSFLQIADKYTSNENMVLPLANKIINGGGGVWGKNHMSAHPQIKQGDAEAMVRYILSLNNATNNDNLPLKGNFFPDANFSKNGTYKLWAKYTDNGAPGVSPLTAQKMTILKSPYIKATQYASVRDHFEINDLVFLAFGTSYIHFKNINFSGVKSLDIAYFYWSFPEQSTIELRLDSPKGEKVGEATITKGNGPNTLNNINMAIKPVKGTHDVYFCYNLYPKTYASVGVKAFVFKNQ